MDMIIWMVISFITLFSLVVIFIIGIFQRNNKSTDKNELNQKVANLEERVKKLEDDK